MIEAGRKGRVRTEGALDHFAAGAEAFLPGTAMGYLSIPHAGDRRALVELLKGVR